MAMKPHRLLAAAFLFLFAGLAQAIEDPLDARVTVRVKDAPLAVFLDTISAQSGVNFLISDEVEHLHLTASLRNVTVREALQLLEWRGLTYYSMTDPGRFLVAKR